MVFKYNNVVAAISNIFSEKRSNYQSAPQKDIATSLQEIQEPITNAPPEIRQIIERVLQTEKDKLYQKNPRHINDDILKIIKEIIQ